MRWADLVLSYLRVLVWPAVVSTFALVFREQFAALIGRIVEMSGGGVKIKLREEAKKAEALAEALPDEIETPPPVAGASAETTVGAEQPSDERKPGAYIRRQGTWVPLPGVEGILRIWQSVEAAAHQLGDLLGLSAQDSRNVNRVVQAANARGLVSDIAVQLTSQMQQMRNQIVHSDVDLSPATADSIMRSMALVYATLQTVVSTELDRIRQRDESGGTEGSAARRQSDG